MSAACGVWAEKNLSAIEAARRAFDQHMTD